MKEGMKELNGEINNLCILCRKYKIPIFISFYDEDKKKYINKTITPEEVNTVVENDRFPGFLRVVMDFDKNMYED